VLNYLNQKGYKKAEFVLKREANLLTLEELEASYSDAMSSEIEGLIPSRFGNGMLSSKAEMANPDAYDQAYSSLRLWVENSLDLYKVGFVHRFRANDCFRVHF